jgi:hypothetical protein
MGQVVPRVFQRVAKNVLLTYLNVRAINRAKKSGVDIDGNDATGQPNLLS